MGTSSCSWVCSCSAFDRRLSFSLEASSSSALPGAKSIYFISSPWPAEQAPEGREGRRRYLVEQIDDRMPDDRPDLELRVVQAAADGQRQRR